MKLLLQNFDFLQLCISLTGLYWVITGIQYWMSDYMITQIKIDPHTVFIGFGIVSITGPVLGVVVGGNVTTHLGGYTAQKSLYSCCAVSIFCVCCSLPIPFISEFYGIVVLLWFLLFFGGGMLPCMTGAMLSTVDQELKTTANSLANLSYNLLGFLPAPFVYGLISDSGDGNNVKAAMTFLMFVPFVTVIFLCLAVYSLDKKGLLTIDKPQKKRPKDRKRDGRKKPRRAEEESAQV
mmetsp:Transcript_16621/g.28326  ORF Transcript_16621/g.28326 Transcript_16621/m.28326 type:complete len:236 (+) Transcript_16621:1764-2471(+)